MSGHSKWSKIKRAKGANDEKRGKIFTKLSKAITLAAQDGGADPDTNFALRFAIDQAKAANMPADKIDRAAKKGAGELKDEEKIVTIVYEAYVAGTIAMLIQCQTDNTNRALTEVKNIVENTFGGKLVPEGSVLWQFSEVGLLFLGSKKFIPSEKYGQDGTYEPVDVDELQIELMEVQGIEDITLETDEEGNPGLQVITAKEDFAAVNGEISAKGVEILQAELGYVASEPVKVTAEEESKVVSLQEALDESDEVANTWTNAA